MKIGSRDLWEDPVLVIAEIGINHNGELANAEKLIRAAAQAGADAVKFQVGDPKKYYNREVWEEPRTTPWGVIPRIEYRKRMELSDADLYATRRLTEDLGMMWIASPLEVDAVQRVVDLDAAALKIASPMLTHHDLLDAMKATDKPVILSTGMSTLDEIDNATLRLHWDKLALMHCTSIYPCPSDKVNLRVIAELQKLFPGRPIGHSGHTTGLPETLAAVALGARLIERHLTLSRAMWGSDHAASLEPEGLRRLVGYVRTIEAELGDGEKRVYDEERENMRKFRRIDSNAGD